MDTARANQAVNKAKREYDDRDENECPYDDIENVHNETACPTQLREHYRDEKTDNSDDGHDDDKPNKHISEPIE
jgi:hypothetical protein